MWRQRAQALSTLRQHPRFSQISGEYETRTIAVLGQHLTYCSLQGSVGVGCIDATHHFRLLGVNALHAPLLYIYGASSYDSFIL